MVFFFFSSRRRHTRCLSDWSSDVCSSDLHVVQRVLDLGRERALEVVDRPSVELAHPTRFLVETSAGVGGVMGGTGGTGVTGNIPAASSPGCMCALNMLTICDR